jgi:hypothetical protein
MDSLWQSTNPESGVNEAEVDSSPDQKKSNLNPGSTNKPMKRILVDWSGQAAASTNKVTIQIRSSELLAQSLLEKDLRDARSLIDIQKLNMLQFRRWEKFPARILRSL